MIEFENGGRLVQSLSELPNLKNAKSLYLDTETTSFDPKVKAFKPYHGHRICGIGVTADDIKGAWYLPIRCHRPGWNLPIEGVINWTRDTVNSCTDWVNHNVKFDAHFLKQDGIDFDCRLVDTLTLAKIINSDRFSHKLADLSSEWLEEDISYLDNRLQNYLTGCKSKDYGDVPGDIIGEYGCQDVLTNRKLYNYMLRRRHEQTKGIWETEILLTPVLYDMEVTGLCVDPLEITKNQVVVLYKLLELEEELHKLTGFAIRPHTNADCFEVLCNRFGLPVMGYTDKNEPSSNKPSSNKPSFNKAAMLSYLSYPIVKESPELMSIVTKIQKYRKMHTLNSIFLQPYQEHQINGLMHPDYNQIVRTGRMSCRRPNSQQLSKEAKALIHPPEDQEILSWDYCLPAGTKIPTPYGDKPIEEVAENLLPVLSLENGKDLKFCKTSRGARVGRGAIYRITFDDGSTFECTKDHGFLTLDNERINCCDLKSGTRLKHVQDSKKGKYPSWGLGRGIKYKHILSMQYFTDETIDGYFEHVHHKDKNKEDWCIDNLELKDSFDHASEHAKENYKVQDHTLRIEKLRDALKNRRTYDGSNNPNWQGGKAIFACEVCGDPIECWPSQRESKKYCSEECRKIGWKKSRTKRKVTITCEYCGKKRDVIPSQAFRIYCSQECSNRGTMANGFRQKNYKVSKVEYVRDDWFYSITVPDTGCYITTNGLVNFNSQIEFRIIISYIKDAKAIAAFAENPDTDFHQWVADMCEIPRKPAKNVNFAIAFGGGKAKVVSMLSLDMSLVGHLAEKADAIISSGKANIAAREKIFQLLCNQRGEQVYQEYHDTLPGIKRTTTQARDNLISRGYVFNLYGRQRNLPEKAAFRAFNTIVQSCAADVIKERMVALAPRYNKMIRELGIKNFASVHDEVAHYAPKGLSKDLTVLSKIKAEFENTNIKFRVPLRISCGTSNKNWAIASGDDGKIVIPG